MKKSKNINVTKLKKQIERLHCALNDLLAIFIMQHGYEYCIVDEALEALAMSDPDLPITVAFYDKVEELRKSKEQIKH
jgi:hypothetical protein